MWSSIESDLGEPVPQSLKYLLVETGYDNIVSLRCLDDKNISVLENFIDENALHRELASKVHCVTASLYENMGTFRFAPGHKQFLKAISLSKRSANQADGVADVADNELKEGESAGKSSFLLQCLMDSQKQQNRAKSTHGYRYSEYVKQFFTYAYLISGRLSYETLHANLPIPSVSAIQNYLSVQRYRIVEGKLHCEELLDYLKSMNCELRVWLAEDATGT